MRKGRLHNIFEIDKKPGLSNYLSGIIEAEDKDNISNYIKTTNITNLYVMPSGDVPPNPSELLGLERTSYLIEELKEKFDIIIFDGTPSLIVTDALILSRQVDATLIVTSYKLTKMGDVEKIKKSIENVGGKIIGMVLNKIPISSKKYESSYYYGNKEKRIKDIKEIHKKTKEQKKIQCKQKNEEESKGIQISEIRSFGQSKEIKQTRVINSGRRARNQRGK